MNNFILLLAISYWGSMGYSAENIAFMGGGAPVITGASAIFINPGAIHGSGKFTAEFSYIRPFELPDLVFGEASAVANLKSIAVGIGVNSKFIKNVYHENTYMLGGAFKRDLGHGISAGIGMTVRNLRIGADNSEIQGKSMWMADLGSVISVGPLRISYSYQNLSYRKNDADYCKTLGAALRKSGITAGFTYQWHRYYETYSLFAEAVVLNVLALRVGYSDTDMAIGAGIIGNGYKVDVGMSSTDGGTTYSLTFGLSR